MNYAIVISKPPKKGRFETTYELGYIGLITKILLEGEHRIKYQVVLTQDLNEAEIYDSLSSAQIAVETLSKINKFHEYRIIEVESE